MLHASVSRGAYVQIPILFAFEHPDDHRPCEEGQTWLNSNIISSQKKVYLSIQF